MVLLGAILAGIAWVVLRNQPVQPILRTVAVGPSPLAVRVDEHSHHAFVLSVARDNSSTAEVSMIDTTTGRLLRATVVAQFPQALTMDMRTGHVFIANADNTVRILDARTGDVLRTSAVRAASGATTMMVDGAPYAHVFMLGDMNVSMLDAESGRVLRTVTMRSFPQALAVDAPTGRVFVTAYSGSGSGRVCMLDARSGRLLQKVVVGGSPVALAVAERTGRVVVAAVSPC